MPFSTHSTRTALLQPTGCDFQTEDFRLIDELTQAFDGLGSKCRRSVWSTEGFLTGRSNKYSVVSSRAFDRRLTYRVLNSWLIVLNTSARTLKRQQDQRTALNINSVKLSAWRFCVCVRWFDTRKRKLNQPRELNPPARRKGLIVQEES